VEAAGLVVVEAGLVVVQVALVVVEVALAAMTTEEDLAMDSMTVALEMAEVLAEAEALGLHPVVVVEVVDLEGMLLVSANELLVFYCTFRVLFFFSLPNFSSYGQLFGIWRADVLLLLKTSTNTLQCALNLLTEIPFNSMCARTCDVELVAHAEVCDTHFAS